MTQKHKPPSPKGSTAPSTSSSTPSSSISPATEDDAATRYARELAALREELVRTYEAARADDTILNAEIDRLREGIAAAIDFSDDDSLRAMLRALLHEDEPE